MNKFFIIVFFYHEYSGYRSLSFFIGWMDRLFPVHEQTAAAASIQVQRFITAQVQQDLCLLREGDACGLAGCTSLYGQYDDPAIAGITDRAPWVQCIFAADKESFFHIGDPDGSVVDEDGASTHGRLHFPALPMIVVHGFQRRDRIGPPGHGGTVFKGIGQGLGRVRKDPGDIGFSFPVDT